MRAFLSPRGQARTPRRYAPFRTTAAEFAAVVLAPTCRSSVRINWIDSRSNRFVFQSFLELARGVSERPSPILVEHARRRSGAPRVHAELARHSLFDRGEVGDHPDDTARAAEALERAERGFERDGVERAEPFVEKEEVEAGAPRELNSLGKRERQGQGDEERLAPGERRRRPHEAAEGAVRDCEGTIPPLRTRP